MSRDVKETKGLTRLHGLTAAEISLVPTGANKRRFLIFKSSKTSAEGRVGFAGRIRRQVLERVLKSDPAMMGKVRELIQQHNIKNQTTGSINVLGNQHGEGGDDFDDIDEQGVHPSDSGNYPENEGDPATGGMVSKAKHNPFDDDEEEEDEDDGEGVHKDELTAEGRKHIADENFALPGKRYPIHDINHARNALARSSGKPEEGKVKAAVHAKYPSLRKDGVRKDGGENDMDGYGDVGTGSGGGGLSKQAEAALQAVVRILTPFKEEIPSDLLNDVLEVGGFQSPKNAMPGTTHAGSGSPPGEHFEPKEAAFQALPAAMEGEEEDFLEGVTKEHMMAAGDEAEKTYKAHLEKLGYQKYPMAKMGMLRKRGGGAADDPRMEGEHVSKSGGASVPGLTKIRDPHTRRVLESVQKSNLELVRKNADLEKALNDQKADARKKEIVLKAGSFKHLGIPQDDVVAQLLDADKLGVASYERVVKSFTALDSQVREGNLFSEFGSSHGQVGGNAESNFDAQMHALAEGIVQKSSGSITREQAYAKAMESTEGQRLYREYKAARPHGI